MRSVDNSLHLKGFEIYVGKTEDEKREISRGGYSSGLCWIIWIFISVGVLNAHIIPHMSCINI